MRTIYITPSVNVKSVLAAQNTYFVVEQDITLLALQYTLGRGSVIEFLGGSFRGVSGTSLNLNGGHVIADPYPIFSNMVVSGFSNSRVYAEWFNSNGDTAPHVYINNALTYAKGCPVVLAKREYQLTGTIKFPQSTPSSLICTGSLLISNTEGWDESTQPVAIEINVSNVSLDVNKIGFPGKKVVVIDKETGEPVLNKNGDPKTKIVPDKGTGIRISGEVFHVSLNVNTILYPERGIDITPGRVGTYANIQYLNIKFQKIDAVYGIYMDPFSVGEAESNWITRCSIHGGRLSGSYGVYMVEGSSDTRHISEISFTSIGFEGLDESALYLRNASRLKFEYIRMAESLPADNKPWIDFKNVSYVSFSVNGGLNADKYVASGSCSCIVIKGAVLKDTNWGSTPYDMIVIDSISGVPQKAATYSVGLDQMKKFVSLNSTCLHKYN